MAANGSRRRQRSRLQTSRIEPMKLYHVRGRLFCEWCVLRCRSKLDKERAVVIEHEGLECDRCARFGFPNLPKKAREIIRGTRPSGYRPMAIINEYEGTIYANGPLRNSDPGRWAYGFTKADVTAAQRELKAVGIKLPWDVVDAALLALHYGGKHS
jgi:hypothetical protein